MLVSYDGRIALEHLPVAKARAAVVPAAADACAICHHGPRRTIDDGDLDALRKRVAELERDRILSAIERCGGNQTRAAKLLGMPRRTLVSRLAKYDVPRPRK
jgi:DNA-binding NtrC family response regulator